MLCEEILRFVQLLSPVVALFNRFALINCSESVIDGRVDESGRGQPVIVQARDLLVSASAVKKNTRATKRVSCSLVRDWEAGGLAWVPRYSA